MINPAAEKLRTVMNFNKEGMNWKYCTPEMIPAGNSSLKSRKINVIKRKMTREVTTLIIFRDDWFITRIF